jgi:preprotein translocase subunit YajC
MNCWLIYFAVMFAGWLFGCCTILEMLRRQNKKTKELIEQISKIGAQ